MKLCAACHQDLPKDKFSKKQWKLGAQSQRRCTSCVANNWEVQPLPATANNEPPHSINGVVGLLESMSTDNNEMITVSDEELFKQPPPLEDCPICFLHMPVLGSGRMYQECCGKSICSGCIHAVRISEDISDLCPFCRNEVPTTDKEMIKGYKKRIEMNDAMAIYNMGNFYAHGQYGLPQSMAKALKLWHKAGELGHAGSYHNIGNTYLNGTVGVEKDMKKAQHYWELAAMGGNVMARHNLGVSEENSGNMDKALRHFMIAAMGGQSDSPKAVKEMFMDGHATKDDYATALRYHQAYLDEIRSDQRDKAAAYDENYKYLLD